MLWMNGESRRTPGDNPLPPGIPVARPVESVDNRGEVGNRP